MDNIKIYGLICDNGDGSASMHWFKAKHLVDTLLNGDPESWGANEGDPAEILTFPEGFDFESCGISFSDDEYED